MGHGTAARRAGGRAAGGVPVLAVLLLSLAWAAEVRGDDVPPGDAPAAAPQRGATDASPASPDDEPPAAPGPEGQVPAAGAAAGAADAAAPAGAGGADGAKADPDDPGDPGSADTRPLFNPHWDDGLVLMDRKGGPRLKLRLFAALDEFRVDDGAYTSAPLDPTRQGGANPGRGGRMGNTPSGRARPRLDVGVRGHIDPDLPIEVGIGVSRDSYGIRDFFVDTAFLPLPCQQLCEPELRIGNFVEPYGLERQTDLSEITFMTRSVASTTFGLGHSVGLMVHDGLCGGRFGYALGAFYSPDSENGEFSERETDETVVRDGKGFTGRLWWMPNARSPCSCRQVLLGVSGSVRTDLSHIRFRSRPESYTFGYAIDTDFSRDGLGVPLLEDASSATFLGAEASGVYGPWFAQAEIFQASVSSTRGGDPTFRGGYVMAGVWLTGECRQLGCGRKWPTPLCCPIEPCADVPGRGGVELAARLAFADLNDGNVHGGRVDSFSVELNWWLTENTRLMLNFVHARIEDGLVNEPIDTLQARIQFGF